jgi:hypothetical protein
MNEYGITEYGIWNMKFGIWNMEYGIEAYEHDRYWYCQFP